MYTPTDIRETLTYLYRNSSFFQKQLVTKRPYICPFEVLIEQVPTGSSILDVGCGTGVFLNLLSEYRRIERGTGVDISKTAIETAVLASQETKSGELIEFFCRPVELGLPDNTYDVVSMIDIIHHIAPSEQKNAIIDAADRVKDGGIFLFKDMTEKPMWRAWANRLHDLVLARQWIHYVPAKDIVAWMAELGFRLAHSKQINLLWYGHELFVFEKMEAA